MYWQAIHNPGFLHACPPPFSKNTVYTVTEIADASYKWRFIVKGLIFITKQIAMSFSKPKIDTTPIYSESPLKRKPKQTEKNKYTKYGVKRRAYWDDFDYYKQQVKELTEVNCKQLNDIDKRGFTSYHIDHKISIKYGFDNNIPSEHISDISNLVMLWYKDNIKKNKDCVIDSLNSWMIKH